MDIYGLGVTALEALRGNHPLAGLPYDRMLMRILSPDPLDVLRGDPLRELIGAMTRKDPLYRPRNAREVATLLEDGAFR